MNKIIAVSKKGFILDINKDKPVKEKQRIIVTMDKEGQKGDGMCKVKDYVIITPHTQEGKKYEIEITRLCSTYAFAKKIRDIKDDDNEVI